MDAVKVLLSPEELKQRGTYDEVKKMYVDMIANDGITYYTCNSKIEGHACGNTLPISEFHKEKGSHKNQCKCDVNRIKRLKDAEKAEKAKLGEAILFLQKQGLDVTAKTK